jgi:nucleotide-binding universal stress UspA family protein
MSFVDDLPAKTSTLDIARHLALDGLVVNPRLARRLPPAVAFRYHALPLAEGKNCITVAMADPNDQAAVEAVAAALGTRPYLVKSEPAVIDSLLAEIWPEELGHAPHLLLYQPAGPGGGQIQAYAGYVRDLLSGQLTDYHDAAHPGVPAEDLIEEAKHGYDLIILGEAHPSLLERLVSGPAGVKHARHMSASVLVARQPRWPLKQMLLVTRGCPADDVAVDWATCLARLSQAAVTVLAVVPYVPAAYRQAGRLECGLADWLATDTILGRQLRQMARRLDHWGTAGMLRFRQGPPDRQIQHEVLEGDYDLIVVAADARGRWRRRLQGELVSALLRCTDRPILVAKVTAESV